MPIPYSYRYIVLRGLNGGGIFSMESRGGMIKLRLEAKLKNRLKGRPMLALMTADGTVSTFFVRSLNDTVKLSKSQLERDIHEYMAAAVLDGDWNHILLKGQNCPFDWDLIRVDQLCKRDEKPAEKRKVPMKTHEKSQETKKEEGSGSNMRKGNRLEEGLNVKDCENDEKEEISALRDHILLETSLQEEEKGHGTVIEKQEASFIGAEDLCKSGENGKNETERMTENFLPEHGKDLERTEDDKEFEGFLQRWPGSEWKRVYYPGSNDAYYIEGRIVTEEKKPARCYAVECRQKERSMGNIPHFEYKGKGYYLLIREE